MFDFPLIHVTWPFREMLSRQSGWFYAPNGLARWVQTTSAAADKRQVMILKIVQRFFQLAQPTLAAWKASPKRPTSNG